MKKLLCSARNGTLIAATVFLALATFLLAIHYITRYIMPVHVIIVLLFWFVAVPGIAYYVAFQLNLRKESTSLQAIAGLVVFYAFVFGMAYRLVNSAYIQIIAASFLPSILAVYYIQLIVKQIRRKQDEGRIPSERTG